MSLYFIDKCTFGRGLFALTDIKAGTEVLVNRVILTAKDAVPDYNFHYNDDKDCICLGDGELFNHSSDANIGYKFQWKPVLDDYCMVFKALRDIKEGEQLFIDYRQDSPGLNLSRYGIEE